MEMIMIWLQCKKTTKNAVFIFPILKGQCPDCAHARASSVFSSKDNRTVILISFRTAPPTEISCLHSQVIF